MTSWFTRAPASRRVLHLALPVLLGLTGACVEGTAAPPMFPAKWRSPNANGFGFGGQPSLDGSRLFVQTGHAVDAIDARTGAHLWSLPITIDGLPYLVSLPARDGVVYVADAFSLRAVDAATGSVRWTHPTPATSMTSVNLVDERALYAGTRDGRVEALDPADGHVVWTHRLVADTTFITTAQGVSRSGDTLYVTGIENLNRFGTVTRGHVVALDRRDAHVIWHYATVDRGSYYDPPTIVDDMLYASDADGRAFVAIDRRDGHVVWRTPTRVSYFGPSAAPVVAGDVVYGGSNDAHAYALRRSDGAILWDVFTGASNSHMALCGNGSLLAEAQGTVVLHRRTGRQLRLLYATDEDFTTSGFVVRGKRVYAAGTVATYAFDCE